jgi:hypothetical protein
MNTKNHLCELLLVPVLLVACTHDGSDDMMFGADLDESADTDAEAEADAGDEAEDDAGDETADPEPGDTGAADEGPADDAGETGSEGGGETGMDETGELPDTEGDDTGVEPPFGDGDSSDLPAVRAQFRNTAGAPVTVTGPLFNEEPLDVRGLQYVDAIAPMGDESDHLAFNIVPGENDPTIRVLMECDDPSVRAEIRDEDDALVGSVLCGEGEQSIFLAGASSLDTYQVIVLGGAEDAGAIDYVLSVNAFCFQQCNYAPYTP